MVGVLAPPAQSPSQEGRELGGSEVTQLVRGAIFLHKHQPAMTANFTELGFAAAYAGAVGFCDVVATPALSPLRPPLLLPGPSCCYGVVPAAVKLVREFMKG